MPTSLIVALVIVVATALIAWTITSSVRQARARRAGLERAGFVPCPDRKGWLEEAVTRMAHDGDRYEVREPRRLRGDADVYHYLKVRHGGTDETPMVEEEVLFPLERPSSSPVRLVLKPSSIAPGLATRILSTIAVLPAGAKSDRFQPVEVPRDLGATNLLAVHGPRGASLYDLVDSGSLGVLKNLGDVGVMFVQLQDGWCAGTSPARQFPLRIDELLARIRPLLKRS
jgi:hypothetical protein